MDACAEHASRRTHARAGAWGRRGRSPVRATAPVPQRRGSQGRALRAKRPAAISMHILQNPALCVPGARACPRGRHGSARRRARNTHTRTRICSMRVCMCAWAGACVHARMDVSKYACVRACMVHACAQAHVCVRACMHARAYMHACMHARTHACTHACMHARTHACTHACISV